MKRKLNLVCFSTIYLLLLAGCLKDPPKKDPPIANAGNSQTIQLPITSTPVTMIGSGTTKNGSIVSYSWNLVSGPNVPVINSPSSAHTTLTGIIAGMYIFEFSVVDNVGLTGVDTISLLVNPVIQQTITIQPSNNPNDAHVDSYNPAGGAGDTEMEIGSWTIYGYDTYWRSYLKFDQSQIPSGSTIISATLYLFAMPTPHAGDVTKAHSGSANSFYVERITGSWNPTLLAWSNLPVSTANNHVSVPQSTSSFENSIVDVTAIVSDMQTSGNYGFAFRLQNETIIYNFRTYASSTHSNAALHPKLVITYQ